MQTNIPLESMPVWLLIVGGVVAVAQLSFEILALVDMLRRPSERLTLGGRKWLWAILILGVSWIGAIVYFAAGGKPALAVDAASASPVSDRAGAAVSALYGPKKDGDAR